MYEVGSWSRKSKVKGPKSELGSQKSEVGSRKSEVRSQKSEVGRRKSEVGRRKSEIRSPKSEVRSPKSEVRSRKASSAFVGKEIYSFLLQNVSYTLRKTKNLIPFRFERANVFPKKGQLAFS